jgi:hypothetical protein
MEQESNRTPLGYYQIGLSQISLGRFVSRATRSARLLEDFP